MLLQSAIVPSAIFVIPAKAGTDTCNNTVADGWVPAFAGMTI